MCVRLRPGHGEAQETRQSFSHCPEGGADSAPKAARNSPDVSFTAVAPRRVSFSFNTFLVRVNFSSLIEPV